MLSSPPNFLCKIKTFTHCKRFTSPDLTPIKHGDSLIMNFVSISRFGLSAFILAATVLPVTNTSTWPAMKADIVAALSPNLLIFADLGAIFVSSRSSNVPPVNPIVLLERSASDDMTVFFLAKTPEKNGA